MVTSPHVKGKHYVSLTTGDFTRYKKLAVWFGNEVSGVSGFAVGQSELCVSIPMYGPMYGIVESLNLGTSTSTSFMKSQSNTGRFRTQNGSSRRSRYYFKLTLAPPKTASAAPLVAETRLKTRRDRAVN